MTNTTIAYKRDLGGFTFTKDQLDELQALRDKQFEIYERAPNTFCCSKC